MEPNALATSLRPEVSEIQIPAKKRGKRATAPSLLTALVACALGASGCVRFGYHDSAGSGGHSGSGRGGRDASSGSGGADGGDDADGGALPSDDAEAGPSDGAAAAGGDAAVDGSVVVSEKCPEHPGWLFCDGFEPVDDPMKDRWGYRLGYFEVTTERKKSQEHALRAYTSPTLEGKAESRWAADVLGQQKSGHAYMRSYNYLPDTVAINDHFSLGIISDSTIPFNGFELRLLNKEIAINYSIGSNDFVSSAKGKEFPRGRWVCVELHVLIDAKAGMYEVFVDGERAVWVEGVDTLPENGFSVAEVGIHYASAQQGPAEVYVDDVVVATSPIGCN